MIVSTLPDLPGQRFEVRGLVFAQATLVAIRGKPVEGLVASLVDQAGRLGADAIVDVKAIVGGDSSHCVMTGTAVRLLTP